MIHELRNHWYVETPVGSGRAILIETADTDYYWTVVLDDGAIVSVPQRNIRVCRHYTYGITFPHEEMRSVLKAAAAKKSKGKK